MTVLSDTLPPSRPYPFLSSTDVRFSIGEWDQMDTAFRTSSSSCSSPRQTRIATQIGCSRTSSQVRHNFSFSVILLASDYNKLVRPVSENGETLVVTFKLKLSQLLDVHEKNQIMTTNVWLQHVRPLSRSNSKMEFQSWMDYKLRWDPAEYGGVEVLYVPSDTIWLPDVVLYNK